jgi:nicotinamide riboside kinase
MLVFVCGPHSAGKTTIISRLKANGVVSISGDEIGKRLFYERRLQPETQGPEFEHEVINQELARDAALENIDGIKIVETWHPGNLAYAAIRNPSLVPSLRDKCLESPMITRAYGIYLKIPYETIGVRTKTFSGNRQWAQTFYGQIDSQLPIMLNLLGLTSRTCRVDASLPLDVVYKVVENWILRLPQHAQPS